MAKKVTKTIPVVAALNETAWYEQRRAEISKLSATARLALKRNMKILNDLCVSFRELRAELDQELRDNYSTDEKSYETKDDEGRDSRAIKDEFLEEWNKDVAEVNEKLNKLSAEEEDVELYVIDLDAEIERIDEKDLEIDDATIDMLSMFEGDE